MSLKIDYLDYIPSNDTRYAKISDDEGNVIYDKVKIEDVTVYSQEGTAFGAGDINAINTQVNANQLGITNIVGGTTAVAKASASVKNVTIGSTAVNPVGIVVKDGSYDVHLVFTLSGTNLNITSKI